MTIQIGDKIWGLPLVDGHPESVVFDLVKILDRRKWGLNDIYDVSHMIEREPVIKEVILELIEKINSVR